MAIKLINANIMHIKPSCQYKNVWQQIDSKDVRTNLLSHEVENLMGEDLTKAVRETLGISIPESICRGHFEKDDTLIPVLFDQGKVTFFKLSFKKVIRNIKKLFGASFFILNPIL